MKQAETITGVPNQLAGETDRDYERRVIAFLEGDDVRTKTDLIGWTGSLPFHLNREPQ